MAVKNIKANLIVDGTISKLGGTSSQFLKADGSVDSNTYLTTYVLNEVQELFGINPTLDTTSGVNSVLVITGDTTVTFENLSIGSSGRITVVNSSTDYDIDFEGYSVIVENEITTPLTITGGSYITVICWYYDGHVLFIEKVFVYDNDYPSAYLNTNLLDLRLSSQIIDERLAYWESIDITGAIIDIRGNELRTPISDNAFATLILTNEIWEDDTDIDNIADLGLTSAEVDARLIYLASSGIVGKVIDCRGNELPTSASSDAIAILTFNDNNEIQVG